MYKLIPGYMKYKRTGKMLGGPANGTLRGPANVAIGATGGGAFLIPLSIKSATRDRWLVRPVLPAERGQGSAVPDRDEQRVRRDLEARPAGQPKAAENRTSASFGGPVTQGNAHGRGRDQTGVEKYVLKGYDRRGPAYGPTSMGQKAVKGGVPAYKAGQGRLQLVTGSISLRSFTGSNANQGVLNFKIRSRRRRRVRRRRCSCSWRATAR
jgi:hypothetical protein